MNILILEDRGAVAIPMAEMLENDGNHKVFSAFSLLDAKSIWETEHIDCIIADLNMPPDGLTKEEAAKTEFGLLTGLIWLNRYVFSHNPSMRKRTIILTEYLQELYKRASEEDYEDIIRISKRGASGPAEKILRHVRSIEQGLKGE